MINAGVLYELSDFNALMEYYRAYPQMLNERIGAAFEQKIAPYLLNELRHYPAAAKHPFEFATPKSKRYYFYAVRNRIIPTVGGRYQRTNKLKDGWKVGVIVADNAVTMFAENRVKYEKWVTGKRQVPGHKNTGWFRASRTVDFWREVARETIGSELKAITGS